MSFSVLHVGSIDEKAAGFPFENATWDSCDRSCILSGIRFVILSLLF